MLFQDALLLHLLLDAPLFSLLPLLGPLTLVQCILLVAAHPKVVVSLLPDFHLRIVFIRKDVLLIVILNQVRIKLDGVRDIRAMVDGKAHVSFDLLLEVGFRGLACSGGLGARIVRSGSLGSVHGLNVVGFLHFERHFGRDVIRLFAIQVFFGTAFNDGFCQGRVILPLARTAARSMGVRTVHWTLHIATCLALWHRGGPVRIALSFKRVHLFDCVIVLHVDRGLGRSVL